MKKKQSLKVNLNFRRVHLPRIKVRGRKKVNLQTDFHCHTRFSGDSLSTFEELEEQARQHKIDRIVITDHNTIEGALLAQAHNPGLFIAGEEILTTRGELLAAFVKKLVPPGLSPRETIRLLREQGAFISVSHPFDLQRHGWELPDLLEIIPYVDAIEVFNARCLYDETNKQAQKFARKYHLPGTVGSDAHSPSEIGAVSLKLPRFTNADELRRVIRKGKARKQLSSWWVHLKSTIARWYKKLYIDYYLPWLKIRL